MQNLLNFHITPKFCSYTNIVGVYITTVEIANMCVAKISTNIYEGIDISTLIHSSLVAAQSRGVYLFFK